jgi:hypothetical protein
MSQIKIRAALETALAAIAPALSTAWENVAFTPPASSVPYQCAFVMFAEPDDPEAGRTMYFERGIFHINLLYPLGAGDATARTRAKLIKDTFYRGRSFTSGGVTASVEKTPDAGQGSVDGDRWLIPVKIRFTSQITS